MAAQLGPPSSPFDLRLFDDDDDDAEDLAYKHILDGVIARTTPLSRAAVHVDERVTSEAEARWGRLKNRQLTQDERDRLYLTAPNPARHVEMIVGAILDGKGGDSWPWMDSHSPRRGSPVIMPPRSHGYIRGRSEPDGQRSQTDSAAASPSTSSMRTDDRGSHPIVPTPVVIAEREDG